MNQDLIAKTHGTFFIVWLAVAGAGAIAATQAKVADSSLVLHYSFDEVTGETVPDLSSHGNDGRIVKAVFLPEADGRRGVLRFDGRESFLDCGDAESLHIVGDMTFEMRVRQNGPVQTPFAVLFGESPQRSFAFQVAGYQSLVLYLRAIHSEHGLEQTVVPVDRRIFSEEWSHIAVVVEHPRCRFYHDGVLVYDAYLPIAAIADMGNVAKHIGGVKGAFCPMDLDEFRLYRRALTPDEIAAHAAGQEALPEEHLELAVEPRWYEDILAVRLSCKGLGLAGHSVRITPAVGGKPGPTAPRSVSLIETAAGSGRFVGEADFPLDGFGNTSLTCSARIISPRGHTVREVSRDVTLSKPDWVHTSEGRTNRVLPPWEPVESGALADGAVEVRVWGRRGEVGSTPLFRALATQGENLLAGPMQISGRAAGQELIWQHLGTTLSASSATTGATIEQSFAGGSMRLRVVVYVEYDGFATMDCTVEADRELDLEELAVLIPLKSTFAGLCYGDRVFAEDSKVPMAAWYAGAVRGDLSFRFSGCVWLGDEERGLAWYAESDEDWHCADPQRAIRILPRGSVTTFRANLVDTPVRVGEGRVLRYRFALQATPVKPMLRDAWELRIARHEPWGRPFDLPDRVIDGVPELEALRAAGVRHIFYRVADIWPYPLPVHEPFSRALHRTVDAVHGNGLRLYPYLIHQRFPVNAPEFDIHGLHMAKRPTRWYVQRGPPRRNHPRPGPLAIEYGANSQGAVFMCAKSRALQDAYIHSLARRLDLYGDDGVYLDGTTALVGCQNELHGCGYRTADGGVHPTYPVFAVREFLRRIRIVVKQRRPDAVIDVHASFGQNFAALAYADALWVGEQWWHLRHDKPEHVASELSLDHFRTEFMGRQSGVAAETLHYRLGSRRQVAATSLLHDIPVRPNTAGLAAPPEGETGSDGGYTRTMVRLWQLRDRFAANEAEKLFYWKNGDYVRVTPEHCHATLLRHPRNGVLAFVSNLSPGACDVEVQFSLERLGLSSGSVEAVDALSEQSVSIGPDGCVTLRLDSEDWIYLWLRVREGDGG